MPRNYTVLTIKTLFGQASGCAYPGCDEQLIFEDRGRATVVAEIAHIRSEKDDGPRNDRDYPGDINGPENLLLLCGKHHKPVDRHESIYSISELETWKTRQKQQAGRGITLGEEDLRSYSRLSAEEHAILMKLARLAQRVAFACWRAQCRIDEVRQENERVRLARARMHGQIFETHEDGTRVNITDNTRLPTVEQREWDLRIAEAGQEEYPRVMDALREISEEVAVLRMISPSLRDAAMNVSVISMGMAGEIGQGDSLRNAQDVQEEAVHQLWRVANGEGYDAG